MKKLNLKALQLGANEMLTREQLKNVMGGTGSGGSGSIPCNCDNGKSFSLDCSQVDATTCANACFQLCS